MSSTSRSHAVRRAGTAVQSRKPRSTGFFSLWTRSPAKNRTACAKRPTIWPTCAPNDGAKAALAAGEEELVPADYAKRLIAGESPLRVWRELCGLSQVGLEVVSGVNRVQIADIEAGRGKGSVETVRKLADALGVRVDDLV